MAHYLVTGAAGFIGARVAELLLGEKHKVVGVDNVNDAYDVRLKQWRLDRLLAREDFQFHRADICDRPTLEKAWDASGKFDAVVNLAARAGVRPSVEDPWAYLETNAAGTLNVLEECRKRGVKKLVLASTSSLYGSRNETPYREDADTSRPLSPYAASKKAAEALCYTYHYLHGLDVTVLRYFTVYGPAGRPDMSLLHGLDVTVLRYFTVYGPAGRPDMSLFRFIQWITEDRPVLVYGDGTQSRDFTYIDDIARGTVAALKLSGFNVINLGSDRPVVLNDAIRLIESLVGRRAQIKFESAHAADVKAAWANIDRPRERLDWEPQVSHKLRCGAIRRVVPGKPRLGSPDPDRLKSESVKGRVSRGLRSRSFNASLV